ncbi:MAG: hypothetical protein WBD20_11985 [Pirellulaceae bacterium]
MLQIIRGLHRHVSEASYAQLHRGIPPGGPQDRFSFRLANRLLGNADDAGSIEFTLAPARIRFLSTCHIVVGGAPCEIEVDGHRESEWTVIQVVAGAEMTIRLHQTGCRVYLCVAGGLDQDLGFVGDSIGSEVGRTRVAKRNGWEPKMGTVRVLPGPEYEESVALELVKQSWKVATQSSGMGLRLLGPALKLKSFDILSAPVQDGTIQATKDGLLALLRQRGTLGGYPRIASVIDCDVDRLSQFPPGSMLKLQWVSQAKADEACRLQSQALLNVTGEAM